MHVRECVYAAAAAMAAPLNVRVYAAAAAGGGSYTL